jgi:hypothetical protein
VESALFAAALLWLASGGAVPPEDPSLEQARRAAYEYALSCRGGKPERTYEELRWKIVPGGRTFNMTFPDGRKLRLMGWYDEANATVWVAEGHARTHWVLAHEAMHAIGERGHEDVFYRCNLMRGH